MLDPTKTFFTADCHFHHRNIIRYCKRPFTGVADMNKTLIENWNRVVPADGTVIVLGDFCFAGVAKTKEILDQLNGRKILIQGNHDNGASRSLRAGFSEVHEAHSLEINTKNGKQVVWLSHYPYAPKSIFHRIKMWLKGEDTRYLEKRIADIGDWLIHGHIHTHWQVRGRQVNVGVDVWKYTPVRADTVYGIITGEQKGG